jgi:hypothetical protein
MSTKSRITLLNSGSMIHASWPGGCGVVDVGNLQAFRNVSFEVANGPCVCDRYGWTPPCQEGAQDGRGIWSLCRLTAGHEGTHQPSIESD